LRRSPPVKLLLTDRKAQFKITESDFRAFPGEWKGEPVLPTHR